MMIILINAFACHFSLSSSSYPTDSVSVCECVRVHVCVCMHVSVCVGGGECGGGWVWVRACTHARVRVCMHVHVLYALDLKNMYILKNT